MSAGVFTRSVYELENGDLARIRVQPETLQLVINGTTNAAPAGSPNIPGSAVVSRGRRSRGINARLVRVSFPSAPDGYEDNSPIALPWLQAGSFADLEADQTGTYLGAAVVLVGKTAESVR